MVKFGFLGFPKLDSEAKDILIGRVPGARQGLTLALAAAVLNQAGPPDTLG